MGAFSFLVLAGAAFPHVAFADITQLVADTVTTDPATYSGGWTQELGSGLTGTTTEIDFPVNWVVVPPAGPTGGDRIGVALISQCPDSGGITTASVLFSAGNGTTTVVINHSNAEAPFDFEFFPACDYKMTFERIGGFFSSPNIRFQAIGSANDTYPNGSTDAGGLADLAFNIKGVDRVATTTTPAPPSGPMVSNVLFLPGIEGSRLYDSTDKQLWEPSLFKGDQQVQALSLDANGHSTDGGVHTKEGGVIDSVDILTSHTDVYGTFLNNLTTFCTQESIQCAATPYDWRLSLNDILTNGNDNDGNISYINATDTPYIEQTLRYLAATSKTGKVTIIAHSNGGLVAKALMNELGPTETAALIDKVILVAVPQSGAPATLGELLVGFGAGIPTDNFPFLVSAPAARQFGLNSPMAYHLLPSDQYFADVQDPAHPVVSFTGQQTYGNQIADYGRIITTRQVLDDYLVASKNDRAAPGFSDLNSPAIGNATLVQYANQMHASLDSWSPPSGVQVYQIAGWGVDSTVAGVDFYQIPTILGTQEAKYRPDFTEDGDGTVPVPSALMIPVGSNVSDYWIDLNALKKSHGTILSSSEIDTFINSIVSSSTPLSSSHASSHAPSSTDFSKQLRFFIHSPVSLDLYDAQNNHVGLTPDGSVDEQIPGGSYGEFGEVKYITVPAGVTYHVLLKGQATGDFSLDLQEEQSDAVIASTTFFDIPTTASTTASIDVNGDVTNTSPLAVDEDGNGVSDFVLTPKINDAVTIPVLTVTADNKSMQLGGLLPSLTASISGFLNGDTASTTVSGSATCTTTATQASPVGSYPITCTVGTLSSNKYGLGTFIPGTLAVAYRWDGFLQPINDTAHQIGLSQSVFKAGSTVPVKLQLKKANGTPVQAALAPLWLPPQRGTSMNTSVDESLYTDPGTSGATFVWDATSQQYKYNWSTKGLAAGYWYKISIKLDDGTVQTVIVGLK